MDSASLQFVAFGLTAAILSNFSRSPMWRSAVLLCASITFLGLLARNPIALFPLIGFLLLGYAALVSLELGWSKVYVWSIIAVTFAYTWLKKYTLLPESIFIHGAYFTLGLSYIFFRILHLLIITGNGDRKGHIRPGAYLLYTLNFTTFISGPIQDYDQFALDHFANEPIPLGPRVVGWQLERIVRGLFKVNVLATLFKLVQADALAQLLQPVPISTKLLAALRLALVSPFFVYVSFSGYIDIVIALSRLTRARLPENFDRPFSASSFLDFWNRWHMTLSAWLKTYVYNPLLMALMRRISSPKLQPFLGVLCFSFTFFLVGIWHGRTTEFIFFGVLLGAGVSINKLWQMGMADAMGRTGYKALTKNLYYVAFGRGLTFSFFALTNFWFWGNWSQIGRVFHAIGAFHWLGVWLVIWLCATAALALWEWLRSALLSIETSTGPVLKNRYVRVVYASVLGLAAFVMIVLLNQPAPGIVYKTF